jgi:tetratricopeptide (TPR) repeat protein
MSNLAAILCSEHEYAEAEKIDREVLDKRRRVLGPEHPDTVWTMSSLAQDVLKQGHYAEAEKLAREATGIEQRVEGLESQGYVNAEGELADVLTAEGHYQDAEKLYWEAIRYATKTNAVNLLAGSWYDFACMSAKAGRHDKAIEYLSHAVDGGFGLPRMDRHRS